MAKPVFIARQGRRPSGLLGYIVAWVMAVETAAENRCTLDLLEPADGERVLEVGCGHGATLQKAAARAENLKLSGIDFSDVMLHLARRRNRALIAANRLRLDRGDCIALPYGDGAFDKVYTVHTIYFWPRPHAHLGEILRVLAPGGRCVLGFRPGDDAAFSAGYPASVYHMRTAAETKALFVACGFDRVQGHTRDINGQAMNWIVAQKATA